ncbi:MAG: F0F1 ATP synthase subunit B [Dysgonamonadaceae bacterium]|jgi:F-type H+-transporting ATPase subunit b|nr:F0F1 ATP synthase subunit B [Dysgonamonadaceae bacterium]
MSLLTPDPGLLFWMLLSFGVVFFVLAKYGFPIIVKMVDERKAFIDKSLEAAKAANDRLAGIREEGDRILHRTREEEIRILKDANEVRNKIIGEAKEQAAREAAKLIAEAKITIQKEKEMAIRDIRNQVAALSIDIAEKILRRNLDNQAAQRELVDKLIEEAQKN